MMKRKIVAWLALLAVLLTALTSCSRTAVPAEAGSSQAEPEVQAEPELHVEPAVEAAADSTFYLDEHGGLWAWGCNYYGQLGDGSQTDRSIPVKVLERVVQVSAGDYHTLAITDDGALWGWGLCQSSRLLDAEGDALCWVDDRQMPVQTVPVKIMEGVKRANAGTWNTMIIKDDDSLWTTTGVLMDESNMLPDGKPGEGEPGLVHLLDGVADCDAGYDAACAIMPDGTFYTWAPILSPDPVRAEAYLNPTLMGPAQITQGSYGLGQVLSVQPDGTLSYFGINDRGQGAGESNFEYYGLPYRQGSIDLGVKAVQAASGAGFSAVVDENGGLWMWGRGGRGQLGNGATEDAAEPAKLMDDVAQVACGSNHVVALKTDGTVWCWGDGNQGQIGVNVFGGADYVCPQPLPMVLAVPAGSRQVTLNTGYTLTVGGAPQEHWSYAMPASEDDVQSFPYYSTLRSIAALLNGTPAQFDVVLDDATGSAHVTTGVPYKSVGGELTPPAEETDTAVPAAPLYIDGRETALPGYLINGDPAYPLHSICAALGVEVRMDAEGGLTLSTETLAYEKALADARTVEPEELVPLKTSITKDNKYAVWNDAGDKVLVATWNDAPDTYPDGKTVTVEEALWVFSGAEFSDWYTANSAEVENWDLRMAQVLGMKEDEGFTTVTTLWVAPEDLCRPAFDPDVTTSTMTTELAGDEEYQDWFKANIAGSYMEGGYPWTRLGYTYDWADNGTEYGLTEFLIRPGAQVTVERTLTTEEYLNTLA